MLSSPKSHFKILFPLCFHQMPHMRVVAGSAEKACTGASAVNFASSASKRIGNACVGSVAIVSVAEHALLAWPEMASTRQSCIDCMAKPIITVMLPLWANFMPWLLISCLG